MYILETDGEPVGQVRFDIDEVGRAEIDISIATEYRRRGYGAAALRLASTHLFADTDSTEVVAQIKLDNTASARSFEKAGFVADSQVAGRGSFRMILTRSGAR
jgi:RimJ/RimL family protein N-acetyltransferase